MKDRTWFITGASSGVGLALTKMALERGQKVVATSRNGEQLQRQVGIQSSSFLPLEADLTNEASVRQAIQKAVATFGRLDVLVNNAGYAHTGAVEELTDKEVRQQFDVNVFSVFNVLRYGIPYLREQKSGFIFNISSIAGFSGFGLSAAYCASKFALEGISGSLAAELKRFGIHVVAVKPGAINTGFWTALTGVQNPLDAYKNNPDEYVVPQMLAPEVVANAIISASESHEPPFDLFVGADAFRGARERIGIVRTAIENTAGFCDL